MKPSVSVLDIGLVDYKRCWNFQEGLNKRIVNEKIKRRKSHDSPSIYRKNWIVFCEHPPVYTLGKSGSIENLKLSANQLEAQGISFYKINRGGDITHHGPDQLVMYPIFDLEQFFTDIHKYLRFLEEAVILTLQKLGITAGRYDGYTGVWIDADKPQARKICAMGIRTSRWVTMHGIALNVNNKLSYFDNIIPCGIEDKAVTSIEKELGHKVDMQMVKDTLLQNMATLFEFKFE